jgi:hypothetical protein
MEDYTVFPNETIVDAGIISNHFLSCGIDNFLDACSYVHNLPYGYNSDRDDLMILFKEKMGSCTTKHAVIATLAVELELPINKSIGIYPMTEAIVTGTEKILNKYDLPYVPMVHCFLEYRGHRVDLTEGNHNGKNQSVDTLLHTETVHPNISAKDEYVRYRKALKDRILHRDEFQGADIKRILHAREKGLELLKSLVKPR